jgi:molecular chaperone GrpE
MNNNGTEETNKTVEEPIAQEVSEIELLKNTIAELEKSNEFLKDQVLRKAAEFDNYKKRIENDILATTKFCNEELIESLLPVLDDFERYLEHSQDENANNAFYKGVGMIYNKLLKNLEQRGLKKLETVGQQFDVNLHDALLVMPNADPKTPPHTVLKEVEKGYSLHDKIIRHAKVIVSGEINTTNGSQSEIGVD